MYLSRHTPRGKPSFRVAVTFWNEEYVWNKIEAVIVQHCECSNATALFTLKCYVDIYKNELSFLIYIIQSIDPTIHIKNIIYRYMYVYKINGMIESDRMRELPFYSP